MQTFVTSISDKPLIVLNETSKALDNKRLGKQRLECKQIIAALETGVGYVHHPATKMWSNHIGALAAYGFQMCTEWSDRGFADTLSGEFYNLNWYYHPQGMTAHDWPWWFGNANMVAAHRSKLMHKDYDYYRRFTGGNGAWPETNGRNTIRLPYLWPDPEVEGRFTLSAAEYKRDDWEVPKFWHVNAKREVTFETR